MIHCLRSLFRFCLPPVFNVLFLYSRPKCDSIHHRAKSDPLKVHYCGSGNTRNRICEQRAVVEVCGCRHARLGNYLPGHGGLRKALLVIGRVPVLRSVGRWQCVLPEHLGLRGRDHVRLVDHVPGVLALLQAGPHSSDTHFCLEMLVEFA